MAFDENLAARIRTALARKKGVEEKMWLPSQRQSRMMTSLKEWIRQADGDVCGERKVTCLLLDSGRWLRHGI